MLAELIGELATAGDEPERVPVADGLGGREDVGVDPSYSNAQKVSPLRP